MNEIDQHKFEVAPQLVEMPFWKSIVVGKKSHFFPAIMLVAWFAYLVFGRHTSGLMYQLAFPLCALWYWLRFGYQWKLLKLTNHRQFEEALSTSLQAIKRFPNDSHPVVYAAIAFHELGEQDMANAYADEVIKRGERLPLALLVKTKALVKQRMEQRKLIGNSLSEAGEQPTEEELREKSEIHDQVLEEMDRFFKGVNLQPPFLNISMAYYLARLGHLDLAQDELDKAESPIREAKAYRLSNQARIHLLQGEKELALEASTVAVSILPGDWQVLTTHGLMLIRNDHLQEARAVLDQAISNAEKLHQPHSEANYFRAELHERVGDTKSAQRDLDTASHNKYLPYL
ncbi:MAG: hypothetical protein C0507_15650 [Cyanobacteria bacterium PR.3.49]|nr:hypothetical protein [Cyanobacteria bacterium PR.3.49]